MQTVERQVSNNVDRKEVRKKCKAVDALCQVLLGIVGFLTDMVPPYTQGTPYVNAGDTERNFSSKASFATGLLNQLSGSSKLLYESSKTDDIIIYGAMYQDAGEIYQGTANALRELSETVERELKGNNLSSLETLEKHADSLRIGRLLLKKNWLELEDSMSEKKPVDGGISSLSHVSPGNYPSSAHSGSGAAWNRYSSASAWMNFQEHNQPSSPSFRPHSLNTYATPYTPGPANPSYREPIPSSGSPSRSPQPSYASPSQTEYHRFDPAAPEFTLKFSLVSTNARFSTDNRLRLSGMENCVSPGPPSNSGLSYPLNPTATPYTPGHANPSYREPIPSSGSPSRRPPPSYASPSQVSCQPPNTALSRLTWPDQPSVYYLPSFLKSELKLSDP